MTVQSRREEDAVFEGTSSSRVGGRQRTETSFSKRVVVNDQVSSRVIGDRRVDLAFLPYMRSRKVFFRAEGLRPNTRYFPFFDGVKVDDLVREESFEVMSNGNAEFGEKYRRNTTHPEGSSNLESDANGKIEGSLWIPSAKTLRFKAGAREFKLLDININQNDAALSRAIATYTSQGQLETRVRDVESTRTIEYQVKRWTEVVWSDPLAQSFRTPKGEGIFITKAQTYFKTKDSIIPVQLQIRPMVNGSPSATEIVPGAVKFLNPSDVNLPASQTQASVLATPTTFTFDEPVYLKGDTEYCIVLLADSKEYNAYVGETYAFQLGSTEKRIDRQPSMGSLFKSQNGTTWEPDQTKDMVFKLFRANFSTAGGHVVFENRDLEKESLVQNPFRITNGSGTIRTLFAEHGFRVGDDVVISGATGGQGLAAGNINGTRTVTAADGFGFSFLAGNSDTATSDGRIGGNAVLCDQQKEFDIVTPTSQTLQPEATTVNYKAKFTSGESLAAVTGSQTRYIKDADFITDLQVGDMNRFIAPRLIATATNETAELGAGERSVTVRMDVDTDKNNVSPVIDCQRQGLALIHNRIDKQAQSAASGFNVPFNYVDETDPTSGSHLSKWITTATTMAADAVGLKILIAALRPNEADFDVYWRTANEGDDIYAKDWTLVEKESAVAPDERNFREYKYLVGGQNGTMDAFIQYQLKIVMKSTNSSKVPYFKDLRVIALAD